MSILEKHKEDLGTFVSQSESLFLDLANQIGSINHKTVHYSLSTTDSGIYRSFVEA